MANRFLAVVLMLAAPGLVSAAAPPPQKASAPAAGFGSLSGKVLDSRGVPQMGALVTVLAADGRVLHSVYTNELGVFVQERLLPGVYGLKVSLTSFLPMLRENVKVQSGSKAFVTVNLASLTDTLVGLIGNRKPRPETDTDWKWVVRSAGALRPVLRLLPDANPTPPVTNTAARQMEYKGRLEIAGGGGATSGFGGDAGLSTGFSMAQTLFADTTLLLGGNVGFERATPASAFRGILRRDHGDGQISEMSVTVRQIQLPSAYFSRGLSRADNFLSMSGDFEETTQAASWLKMQYGVSYDSVDFLGRNNSVNPHGRLIARISPTATLQASYSQGPERQRRPGDDPLRDVASQLTAFPQMSLRDGRTRVERDRHLELAYRQKLAAQSVIEAVAYSDQVSNFAIGIATDTGVKSDFTGELLPDVFNNSASVNGGTRRINGGRVSWEQGFGDYVRTTASYTIAGLPVPGNRVLSSNNLDELRDILHTDRRQAVALKIGAQIPGSRTRVITSYKWISGLAVLPRDLYSDSLGQIDPNFNVLIRQPLPQLTPFIGRVEALADFRNLLSQGYIPLTTSDGKSIVLLQNVRAFRGGLSFNF